MQEITSCSPDRGYLRPMKENDPKLFALFKPALERRFEQAGLTSREDHVLRVRWGIKDWSHWTYEGLADQLGVTPARVFKIEELGLRKVRALSVV